MTPHSSRSITMTLAASLCSDDVDTVVAVKIVRGIIARGRPLTESAGFFAIATSK